MFIGNNPDLSHLCTVSKSPAYFSYEQPGEGLFRFTAYFLANPARKQRSIHVGRVPIGETSVTLCNCASPPSYSRQRASWRRGSFPFHFVSGHFFILRLSSLGIYYQELLIQLKLHLQRLVKQELELYKHVIYRLFNTFICLYYNII